MYRATPNTLLQFLRFVFIILMCVHVYICAGAHTPWGPEDVRSLGAGIAGICELPDMGVRIQTLVLLIEH